MSKILAILSLFLITLLLSGCVQKENPIITVIVSNASSSYYLDVLFEESMDGEKTQHNLAPSNQQRMDKIIAYDVEEQFSSVLLGSIYPFVGNVEGVSVGNTHKHEFEYQIAKEDERFQSMFQKRITEVRIAIANDTDEVFVSEALTLTTFHSTIYYDAKTNTLSMESPTFNLVSFAVLAFLLAIAFDFLCFLLFGYSIDKEIKRFITTSGIVLFFIALLLANAFYQDSFAFAIQQLVLLTITQGIIKLVTYSRANYNRKILRILGYSIASSLITAGWYVIALLML